MSNTENPSMQNELGRLAKETTEDIFRELSANDVNIHEEIFRKMAAKYHSVTVIAKHLRHKATVSDAFILAAASTLWDRLCEGEFLWEKFAGTVKKGTDQLKEGNRMQAVTVWLEAWNELRRYAEEQGIADVSVLDLQAPEHVLPEDVFHFVQDIEMELSNQMDVNPQLAIHLLEYTNSFLETLPKSATPILLNMRTAKAMALFVLGRTDEGDDIFADLCKTYADDAWTFIDWGDQYSPVYHQNRELVDIDKARSIYQRGLETATEDAEVLEGRIASLEEGTLT